MKSWIWRSVITLSLGGLFASVSFGEDIRVPGTVSGFGDLKVDNKVDGALVLKSFRPSDLLNFRIDQFIAPNEPMKAGPQTVSVPGNFYFPSQKEDWGLFRVEINKAEFGYYTERGAEEEIIATSFQAPFDTLVDMGMNGGMIPSRLLPLITIKKYDFKGNADHSRSSKLSFTLNGDYKDAFSYKWNRSNPPTGSSDHIFAFQETPMSRWILADLKGNAARSGKIMATQGMAKNVKALFVRLVEEGKNLKRIQALVRNSDELSESVEGLAQPLSRVQMQGGRVSWDAPNSEGWVSVIAELKGNFFAKNGPFAAFDLHNYFMPKTLVHYSWIEPGAGQADALPPETDDPSLYSISVIFVGSDIATPRPDTDPEDRLFHSMRSLVVEVVH